MVDIGGFRARMMRIGEFIERRQGREFIRRRDENDDFPTVACDLP
jgi:hypothetical protein